MSEGEEMVGTQDKLLALAQSAGQRNWVTTVVPLQEFAGLQHFSAPRSLSDAGARLESNLSYFLSNYAFLCLVTFVYGVIFKPVLLILFGLLVASGYYSLYVMDEIRVGDVVLAGKSKLMAFSAIALTVVFVFAGSTLFGILAVCGVIIVAHGVFHDTRRDIVAPGTSAAVEMQVASARKPGAPVGASTTYAAGPAPDAFDDPSDLESGKPQSPLIRGNSTSSSSGAGAR